MKNKLTCIAAAFLFLLACMSPQAAVAQTLFAVEFKTGKRWDNTKHAHEQAYFADHSASLKRLREQGKLLIGARYGDKGLFIVSAASAEELRALIEADPAVQHATFSYEMHPFNVFYPGCVGSRGKPC